MRWWYLKLSEEELRFVYKSFQLWQNLFETQERRSKPSGQLPDKRKGPASTPQRSQEALVNSLSREWILCFTAPRPSRCTNPSDLYCSKVLVCSFTWVASVVSSMEEAVCTAERKASIQASTCFNPSWRFFIGVATAGFLAKWLLEVH